MGVPQQHVYGVCFHSNQLFPYINFFLEFFLTYAQLGTSFISSFKIVHKRFVRYKCPWYNLFVASFSLFLFRLVVGVLVAAEFQLGFLLLCKCCLWYLLILLLLTTPLEHLDKLLLKLRSYTSLIISLDQQV